MSSTSLIDNLAGYKIQGQKVSSFRILKVLVPYLLVDGIVLKRSKSTCFLTLCCQYDDDDNLSPPPTPKLVKSFFPRVLKFYSDISWKGSVFINSGGYKEGTGRSREIGEMKA